MKGLRPAFNSRQGGFVFRRTTSDKVVGIFGLSNISVFVSKITLKVKAASTRLKFKIFILFFLQSILATSWCFSSYFRYLLGILPVTSTLVNRQRDCLLPQASGIFNFLSCFVGLLCLCQCLFTLALKTPSGKWPTHHVPQL